MDKIKNFIRLIVNRIKDFIELTRGYSLLVTFASCFVIYAYAHYSPIFNFTNFFLIVFSLCCVHLCANLYDDYRDVRHELEKGKTLNQINFSGFRPKARLILNGTYSIRFVRILIGILSIIPISLGLAFAIACHNYTVILYMIAGGVLTALYPYSSRFYCAELIVGLIFGPLMIMGGYNALTLTYDTNLLILSFAIMFATLVLLHVHSIMDWEFDIQSGKKTLAIMSGSKQNAIKVLAVMVSLPYIIILAGVLLGNIGFNPYILFAFLTLPIATKLIPSMKEYIEVKDVKFKPRWYWGFFENWKAIKEAHLEFFFFRFYLARNFSFWFALFATIGVMK